AALGFEAFAEGDLEAVKVAHRRYARRQMTWLRKTPGIQLVDRGTASSAEAARRIESLLGNTGPR
ncbi:MAG: hypothetical protein WBF18_07015, partial [Solirubrobacterales bacterium]